MSTYLRNLLVAIAIAFTAGLGTKVGEAITNKYFPVDGEVTVIAANRMTEDFTYMCANIAVQKNVCPEIGDRKGYYVEFKNSSYEKRSLIFPLESCLAVRKFAWLDIDVKTCVSEGAALITTTLKDKSSKTYIFTPKEY